MKKSFSIASITIAYNSAQALGKQLDALLRQSWRLDEIIVIDNGSRDATVEMVRSCYPQVTLIEHKDNLGVGAGIAAGLTYSALQKKYDFTWILDQDSLPERDALDELVQGYCASKNEGRNVGLVACVATHEESGLSYKGLFWRGRLVQPADDFVQPSIWFVDATITSGSMVLREVVELVGLPRADFFMDFVDFEYCLRIRRLGYEIALVRDSVLHHTLGSPRSFRFLGYRKAWSNHAPWRQYYIIRNHTYVVWHSYPQVKSKLFMLERLARHSIANILFGERKLESVWMMLLGFLDGRAGRLGIRFCEDRSNRNGTHPKDLIHASRSADD